MTSLVLSLGIAFPIHHQPVSLLPHCKNLFHSLLSLSLSDRWAVFLEQNDACWPHWGELCSKSFIVVYLIYRLVWNHIKASKIALYPRLFFSCLVCWGGAWELVCNAQSKSKDPRRNLERRIPHKFFWYTSLTDFVWTVFVLRIDVKYMCTTATHQMIHTLFMCTCI